MTKDEKIEEGFKRHLDGSDSGPDFDLKSGNGVKITIGKLRPESDG